MDATDTESVENAFARIGAFDHLVLALGSGKGFGPFASMKLADVRQGFEEKVYPHFACAQAAIPFLHKGGSVTFVSAVSAHAAMRLCFQNAVARIGQPEDVAQAIAFLISDSFMSGHVMICDGGLRLVG